MVPKIYRDLSALEQWNTFNLPIPTCVKLIGPSTADYKRSRSSELEGQDPTAVNARNKMQSLKHCNAEVNFICSYIERKMGLANGENLSKYGIFTELLQISYVNME